MRIDGLHQAVVLVMMMIAGVVDSKFAAAVRRVETEIRIGGAIRSGRRQVIHHLKDWKKSKNLDGGKNQEWISRNP